ncbi:hypothetical protein BDV33DRAFT_170838 [Aspergillus novoparasiticus]|uniref:Zn(2)-C6 fungal-type domain-containing protein n=1 Tax=Aspergillus novoparasiticus TaxID=986946 RepID=A0A5N6EUA6_9EURO|nr:hypothetical protein BDV33DRAFT_170838 [Aspergillus novoparasiticus]
MTTDTIATAHPQNPISCEPCRQKKCKCDRLLPICTQCATTPSSQSRCIYPESGKRFVYIHHASHSCDILHINEY